MARRPALFEPVRVGSLELSNRIVVAPMCQYSAESGCMNDWHLIHLGHLSLSGAALRSRPQPCSPMGALPGQMWAYGTMRPKWQLTPRWIEFDGGPACRSAFN
jgi:2,4-dienoyl-CoA reductase-like NADH-dependent reductase (Old Yellow Enzyme family)